MQPSYDSWDYEQESWQPDHNSGSSFGGPTGFEDPNVAAAYGLADISKGKGKDRGGNKGDAGKGRSDTWDTWDSWDSSSDAGGGGGYSPPLTPSGLGEVPRPHSSSASFSLGDQYTGKGGFGSSKGPGGLQDAGRGKGGIWRTPAPDPFAKADSNSMAKGGLSGKTPEPALKGKPGFSFKGKLAPRKADFNSKVDFPNPKPTSNFQPAPLAFSDSKAAPPSTGPALTPPPAFVAGKGSGFTQPSSGPVRAQISSSPLTSVASQIDGTTRGPVRPAPVVAPRLPVFRADAARAVPPRLSITGQARTPGPTATSLGNALAVAAARGAGTVFRPGPPVPQQRFVPPRPLHSGQPGAPPPPSGPVPAHVLGHNLAVRGTTAAGLGKMPPALANVPHTGLAPELAALVSAGGEADLDTGTRLGPPIVEKKPRIYLLVTRLAPELEEGHLQQIIEQCGEVQAFRRGRDADGSPLSFGFAQFGDPEAAWKASTCLSKRVLCGQEIKVLVEEHAETLIQQWRRSQQVALRVNTDEELDWELERKAVSCKASIDAKVEEIFGPPEDGSGGGAIAQRRQELREKEKSRIERMRKRKAWREEEFAKELERLESTEKRLRKEEIEKDEADRKKEEVEQKEKEEREEQDLKLSKLEEATPGARQKGSSRADNRKLVDMVDTVQAEPRDELFRMELNLAFLRTEKVLEKKLRPWLERKVDLCMGGPQSDLVEYILRRINASSMPDSLISELTRYLDDNAEPLVERMWRMLAFELMRGGLVLSGAKRGENGQQPLQGQRA